MNNILQLSALFIAQLGFGSALILPFFPLKATGKSFHRFYYGFILILFGIFSICLYRLGQPHLNFITFSGLACWIWILSFTKAFSKVESIMIWFFALCSLALLYIYPQKYLFHHVSLKTYTITFLFMLTSTIFLSFHLMNMIFGHWYLVNKEIPIKHLIKTCQNLIIFSYVRVISVGIAIYLAYSEMTISSFSRLTDFMGHGIFFWARILAGLALPVLVSHLAYASAKIHSNQSATGILYAGTIFVIMGEIMALYLFSITGIFF